MSTEHNSQIVRRVPEEIFNLGKLELVDELFAADYLEHSPVPPGWPAGVDGLRQWVSLMRTAFPDLHLVVDDILAEGDRVMVFLTATGTQRGALFGLPATDRRATWQESHLCHMAGGRVIEHWEVTDQLGMLRQLGHVPEPA